MKKTITAVFIIAIFCVPAATAAPKEITFKIKHNVPPDIAGYQLRYSLDSQEAKPEKDKAYEQVIEIPYQTCDTSQATLACVSTQYIVMLPGGEEADYYFSVVAYDQTNNYSDHSNEMKKYLDFLAPGRPVLIDIIVPVRP